MSHEIRTPLNAIIGYSEMLLEDAEDDHNDANANDCHKILGAGQHLLALINDILDLSTIEAGKVQLYLEYFSINELVNDVANTIIPLLSKNNNQLLLELFEPDVQIYSDKKRVRQVLFNLLSNASKFTNEGCITLCLDHTVKHPEIFEIRVIDTGIGLTEAQLERLFHAFGQADSSISSKYGGTGLGLVISRRFCQLMGGDIRVDSQFEQGTVFTVNLPKAVIREEIK